MILEILAVLIMAVVTLFITVVILSIAIEQEKERINSLPTLEEAEQQISQDYPGYESCFTLTKKVIDLGLSTTWGFSIPTYGDFLVCEELGVSIRVRLGEKMS